MAIGSKAASGRSGYDPHQPRDEDGKWTETGRTRQRLNPPDKKGRHPIYGFADLQAELQAMKDGLDEADPLLEEPEEPKTQGFADLQKELEKEKERIEQEEAEETSDLTPEEDPDAGLEVHPTLGPGTTNPVTGTFEPKYAIISPFLEGLAYEDEKYPEFTTEDEVNSATYGGPNAKPSNPKWLNRDPGDARSYNSFGHIQVILGESAEGNENTRLIMEKWNSVEPYVAAKVNRLIVASNRPGLAGWFDSADGTLFLNTSAFTIGTTSVSHKEITDENIEDAIGHVIYHELGHSWFGSVSERAHSANLRPDHMYELAELTTHKPVSVYADSFKREISFKLAAELRMQYRGALRQWGSTLPAERQAKFEGDYDIYDAWVKAVNDGTAFNRSGNLRGFSMDRRQSTEQLTRLDDLASRHANDSYLHENFADATAYHFGYGGEPDTLRGPPDNPIDRRVLDIVRMQGERMKEYDRRRHRGGDKA